MSLIHWFHPDYDFGLKHNFVLKKSVLKKGQIFRPLFSGQIFRPDFGPQDKIIRPGMTFRPPDVLALLAFKGKKQRRKVTKIYHLRKLIDLSSCLDQYVNKLHMAIPWCQMECFSVVLMNFSSPHIFPMAQVATNKNAHTLWWCNQSSKSSLRDDSTHHHFETFAQGQKIGGVLSSPLRM